MKMLGWVLGWMLMLGLAGVAEAEMDSPVGLWKTIDDKTGRERSLVRIVENNGMFEGRVEKIFEQPGDDPGKSRRRNLFRSRVGIQRDATSSVGGQREHASEFGGSCDRSINLLRRLR